MWVMVHVEKGLPWAKIFTFAFCKHHRVRREVRGSSRCAAPPDVQLLQMRGSFTAQEQLLAFRADVTAAVLGFNAPFSAYRWLRQHHAREIQHCKRRSRWSLQQTCRGEAVQPPQTANVGSCEHLLYLTLKTSAGHLT